MTTYSNHEQRLLDQKSGAELDRRAARLTLNDVVAIVKPHNDKIIAEHKLDLAWQRIQGKLDALRNRNDFDAGEKSGLEAAQWIIEELGGSDPVTKAREELERLR